MEVMEPFRVTSSGRLEICEGGGCVSLFGVPFLAAGIFVALIAVGIVRVENEAELPAWSWPAMLLMGLVFVAVGSWLVFGRTWIVIEAARGSISKQWGFLVPFKGKELNLFDYDGVVIRPDPDADVDRYCVVLKAQHGSDDLTLYGSTDYSQSRERAAFLARFLGFPLKDQSTDHESVIDPDRAEAPFQKQAQSHVAQQEITARPRAMRSQIHKSGTTAWFTIPRQGFNPVMLLRFIIPAGIATYVIPQALSFFGHTKTPDIVQIIIIGFLVVFFVLIPLLSCIHAILLATGGYTSVKVSASGIVIEEKAVWRTRSTLIPADEILGVDYGTAQDAMTGHRNLTTSGPGRYTAAELEAGQSGSWFQGLLKMLARSKGITVKSKRGFFTFGAGLPDEEVLYLYGIVTRVLGSGEGST